MAHSFQDHSFAKQFNQGPSQHPHSSASAGRPSSPTHEEVARIFNSALVATRVPESRNPASELHELMESTTFRAIMNAVRQVAHAEGIPERQAAEQIIRTFRKMDEIWSNYVFQEGVDRLRNQLGPR